MKHNYSSAEIRQFWVGLFEGDGSIQVNHWKQKSLQYRLVIKLKFTMANKEMFDTIARVIGGSISIIEGGKEGGKFVIWVVNDKIQIQRIIQIFDTYPLLTTKMHFQLEFLKTCLAGVTMDWYMKNREKKFDGQENLVLDRNNKIFIEPEYFDIWFSGFTEAEGSFNFTEGAGLRYEIGQNNDKYLLKAIGDKFQTQAQVREATPKFYLLTIGGKHSLRLAINHFKKFPLLGEKAVSFAIFRGMFITKFGI